MKKIITNTISIFILLLMVNCSEDDFTFGSLQAPTNLQVAVELIGKTAANPNGDGLVKLNLRQLQMQYPINLFFLMERLQTHQVVF
jgi:hypothetical protein